MTTANINQGGYQDLAKWSDNVRQMHEKLRRSFDCRFCGHGFASNRDLEKHEKTHTVEKPFWCALCGFRSRLKTLLNQHIRQEHQQLLQPCYKCEDCGKTFISDHALLLHRRTHTGEKPFKCGDCGKEFGQSSNLTTHVRLVHQKLKLFECGFCGKQFGQKSVLQVHERIHTGEQPFACELCSYRSNSMSHLTRHLRHVHNQQQPYKCDVCEKTFRSPGGLTKHGGTHIGEKLFESTNSDKQCNSKGNLFDQVPTKDLQIYERTDIREKTFSSELNKCGDCSKEFSCKSSLSTHVRLVHQKLRVFECGFCGKTFGVKQGLQVHERTHTGEQPFQCELCSYRSNAKSHLARHIRHVHNHVHPYKCDVSQNTLHGQSELAKHCATHTVEKLFETTDYDDKQCNSRSNLFDQASKKDLQVHENTDTVEQSFSCELCDHKSKSKNLLNQHVWQEHDEQLLRPCKCDDCGKTFVSDHALMLHRRTHTGEKPFKCGDCGKEFGQSSNLATHVRLVHQKLRQFECRFCGKQFGQKSVLQVHERIHTGEQPFACYLCKYRSNSRSHLTRHIRGKHKRTYAYKCDVCEQAFRGLRELKSHSRTHTDDKRLECGQCNYKCVKAHKLNTHVLKHHKNSRSDNSDCAEKFSAETKSLKQELVHTESGDSDHQNNGISFGIEQFVEWDSEEEEENDGEDEQMMNVKQIKVEQEFDDSCYG